jgi:HEAT repeat protein
VLAVEARRAQELSVTKSIEEPEYSRWKRKYPRFPGVAKCVDLLARSNVRGSWVDIICGELLEAAAIHGAELIAAFRNEKDARVRSILLSIIAEAKLPEALSVLVETLRSEDETLRSYSERGLESLDTPEARNALWSWRNECKSP